MAKLNPTTMKTQYDGQYDTFCRKNHDYGNSFEESLDQFGIIASLVRMQDKMLRLQSLTDDSKTQQVGSESLLDTLEDLSNYAAMTACWLKGVQAEDDVINKSYHAVKDLIEKCDDSDEYNDVEKEIDALLQKLFRMTENRKGYFATIEYLNNWNSIIIEISNIVKANNISDSHLMDLIFPYTRLESNTILYQVNRNKSSHEDIVVKTDNLEFRNAPVGTWKPLGSEVVHDLIPEHKLDESLSNYIKENVDDCVTRICQLMSRGELPTIGGIEHWTYNIGRCAIDHYEDPYTIIEHVKVCPSFRVLSDKNARLVIDSIKNYITDFNKEKEASKLTDEAHDFLEEQVTRAAGYMEHIRMHGRIPESKDICDYSYDIARYALEHYPDPYRILQHMGRILAMRSLNPNDALLLCGRVTDFIRERTNEEKSRDMAKAMDKACGVVIKGSRGNSNVIVMASRGSGKGLMKTKSLLEELGVPKEDIKEIFEGLEDDDDE